MPINKVAVLVIEDEQSIRRFLKTALLDHGYAFLEAGTGKEGISKLSSDQPDLIILDLGLPDTDGLSVTRHIREWSKVPIIILSAKGDEKNKVEALDAGADDYLTKPFGVAELLARIRVAIRHSRTSNLPIEPEFKFGTITVDFERRLVLSEGAEIRLTKIEYKMLTTLIKYAGKVVTQNQLLKEVWGDAYSEESNYLRVYMTHLRRKLEADPTHPKHLITEAGVGYRLKID